MNKQEFNNIKAELIKNNDQMKEFKFLMQEGNQFFFDEKEIDASSIMNIGKQTPNGFMTFMFEIEDVEYIKMNELNSTINSVPPRKILIFICKLNEIQTKIIKEEENTNELKQQD